ncbi:hypothetical protein ACOME3_004320 [Neoechinorhynchus agilis]
MASETLNCGSGRKMEEPPLFTALFTYLNFLVLYIFGMFRDILRLLYIEKRRGAVDKSRNGFVPLYQSFESFYTRNIYFRVRDCFSRPIGSTPGVEMELCERYSDDYNWSFKTTGKLKKVINLGSYNYLGFAENRGVCVNAVKEVIHNYGVATCSSYSEIGCTVLHRKIEKRVANFLGVEDALVFGMGFATNSTNIPCLVQQGCLVLSDEFNHSSIVLGCRLSQATICPFKHCDVNDLETKLREAIVYGQPRTHRPWKKILVVVEGIYSMEGTIVPLKQIIELRKKYKFYIYLDEAHSIGAIGCRGRGVCDYHGCSTTDIDILMGTFTKSFSASGGYIAGRKEIVRHLRTHSYAQLYASSMSPVIIQQIITCMDVIDNRVNVGEGPRRISQLALNTTYFRRRLREMKFIVYGDDESPVVPVMLFMTSKIAAFNRELLKRGIAVVTVGFPATPLTLARVRFCISACHTREVLDQVLEACSEVGDLLSLRVSRL